MIYKVDKSISDDDFISGVDAFNLLCNLYDELGLDRSEILMKIVGSDIYQSNLKLSL